MNLFGLAFAAACVLCAVGEARQVSGTRVASDPASRPRCDIIRVLLTMPMAMRASHRMPHRTAGWRRGRLSSHVCGARHDGAGSPH